MLARVTILSCKGNCRGLNDSTQSTAPLTMGWMLYASLYKVPVSDFNEKQLAIASYLVVNAIH